LTDGRKVGWQGGYRIAPEWVTMRRPTKPLLHCESLRRYRGIYEAVLAAFLVSDNGLEQQVCVAARTVNPIT